MPQEYSWVDNVELRWEPNTRSEPGTGRDLVAFMQGQFPVFPHDGFYEHFKVGERWRCRVKRFRTYGFAVAIEQVAAPSRQPLIEQLLDSKTLAFMEKLVDDRIATERQRSQLAEQNLEHLRRTHPELFRGGIVPGISKPVPKEGREDEPGFLRVKVLYQMVAGGYWGRRRIRERDLRRGLPSSIERHAIVTAANALVKDGLARQFKHGGEPTFSLAPERKVDILHELELSGHVKVEGDGPPIEDLLPEADEAADDFDYVDRGEFDREVQRLQAMVERAVGDSNRAAPVVPVVGATSRADFESLEKQLRGLQGAVQRAEAKVEEAVSVKSSVDGRVRLAEERAGMALAEARKALEEARKLSKLIVERWDVVGFMQWAGPLLAAVENGIRIQVLRGGDEAREPKT